MKTDAQAPRPAHRRNQTEPVLLRLEPDHLRLINEAAEHMGLARASWMRSALLQAARGVLREAEGR